MLDAEDIRRYSRQLVLPEWSGRAQLALRAASALVAGAGPAAETIALALAGAGVGRLVLVDGDAATAPRVGELDARCVVSVVGGAIAAAEGAALVGVELLAVDLVIDAGAGPARRGELARLASAHRLPWLLAACDGWDGRVAVLEPGDGCAVCLVGGPVDASAPVAPVAAWAAATVATEAVRRLAGVGAAGASRLLVYSGLAGDVRSLRMRRAADCPHAGARA